ncbi:MAG: hypothetical protein NZ108_08935 [Bacteroidia bacterium]|nr:hypothetical protein [Bacteroidia bacterium]
MKLNFICKVFLLIGLLACQSESKFPVSFENNATSIIQLKSELEAIYSQRAENNRITLFPNQSLQLKLNGNCNQAKVFLDIVSQKPIRIEISFFDSDNQLIGTKYFFIRDTNLVCTEWYNVDKSSGSTEENLKGAFYYANEKLIVSLNDWEQPIENESMNEENLEQWKLIRNEVVKLYKDKNKF